MRQDTWVRKYLDHHSFVARHCNLCSRTYYSDIAFAVHLVDEHDDRSPMLRRFAGVDLRHDIDEWLHDPCPRPQDP